MASTERKPIPPSSPMYYPPEPVERPKPADLESIWKNRVGLQRVRNSQQRTYGHTEIPDQGIGFDEDGIPVDKSTTPREVWDRDYQGSQQDTRDRGSQPPIGNGGNQPPTHYGGAAGGNPGDPGGDSSDGDSRRGNDDRPRKEDKKPKRNRRGRTPWDDESSDDDGESQYSTDSVYSELEDEPGLRTKGDRRRHRLHEAHLYEMDKLDAKSRRHWRKRLHYKYRTQIREA
ncbi:hypothetical protein AAF712_016857, partial [Marasmius tenuissimus]